MLNKRTVTEENIHDLIDEWHDGDSSQELHEFLGFTFEEYARWVEKDEFPSSTSSLHDKSKS